MFIHGPETEIALSLLLQYNMQFLHFYVHVRGSVVGTIVPYYTNVPRSSLLIVEEICYMLFDFAFSPSSSRHEMIFPRHFFVYIEQVKGCFLNMV